jgi:hypothetical protein
MTEFLGRYGKDYFDGGGVYGEGVYPEYPLYALEVDWDGDGLFDGSNEAEYLLPSGLSLGRGREHYLKASGDGFERIRAGKLEVRLDNSSRRFDPRNPESPIYPNMRPGRRARLRVRVGTETVYTLFVGKLKNLQPATQDRLPIYKLEIEDPWADLEDQDVFLPVQESLPTDELLGAVLDKVGYAFDRSLQSGVEAPRYYWADQERASTVLQTLAESELGFFSIAADGTATFKNRWDPSTAPVGPIRDGDIVAPPILLQPWEVVRNHIRITVNPMVKRSVAALFELETAKPYIEAGGSLEFWAELRYNGARVAATNLQTPSGADFAVNALEDGTGTDLTASMSLTVSAFGDVCQCRIENNGAIAGYLTTLILRGEPIERLAPVFVSRESGEADAILSLNLPWLQDVNEAGEIAELLLASLSTDNPYPVIELENNLPLQLALDIGTYLSLDLVKSSIAGSYRVCRLEHELRGRRILRTTAFLEPYARGGLDAWRFPVELGVNSKFAY